MGALSPLPCPPSLDSLIREGPIAIFCDFDGTLVELAETPDSIQPRADMIAMLGRLSEKLSGRLALVSGRSIEDIETHLGPVPAAMAGSHGAAKRYADGTILGNPPRGIAENVRENLREQAAQLGIDVEEKTHGIALHYRSNPALENEANALAAEIAVRHTLKTKFGKCVVELVEPGADKGGAVTAFMEHPPFAGATPWFIGDDVTDEDGFRACLSLGGSAILVGERADSCARHSLPNVSAVHQWLEFE